MVRAGRVKAAGLLRTGLGLLTFKAGTSDQAISDDDSGLAGTVVGTAIGVMSGEGTELIFSGTIAFTDTFTVKEFGVFDSADVLIDRWLVSPILVRGGGIVRQTWTYGVL